MDTEEEIYIIDDNPVFSKMLKKILEKNLGIKTTMFHDPVTMLDNLDEYRPSAIVVDYHGPVTGDRIIEQVRDKGNTSLIIMISADDDKANMIKCLKSGANNIILKKNIAAISSLISNHLNIRKSPTYTDLVSKFKLNKHYAVQARPV